MIAQAIDVVVAPEVEISLAPADVADRMFPLDPVLDRSALHHAASRETQETGLHVSQDPGHIGPHSIGAVLERLAWKHGNHVEPHGHRFDGCYDQPAIRSCHPPRHTQPILPPGILIRCRRLSPWAGHPADFRQGCPGVDRSVGPLEGKHQPYGAIVRGMGIKGDVVPFALLDVHAPETAVHNAAAVSQLGDGHLERMGAAFIQGLGLVQ